eukprot:6174645-Pleurochrysis_carterae.AAC.3
MSGIHVCRRRTSHWISAHCVSESLGLCDARRISLELYGALFIPLAHPGMDESTRLFACAKSFAS